MPYLPMAIVLMIQIDEMCYVCVKKREFYENVVNPFPLKNNGVIYMNNCQFFL